MTAEWCNEAFDYLKPFSRPTEIPTNLTRFRPRSSSAAKSSTSDNQQKKEKAS